MADTRIIEVAISGRRGSGSVSADTLKRPSAFFIFGKMLVRVQKFLSPLLIAEKLTYFNRDVKEKLEMIRNISPSRRSLWGRLPPWPAQF